jgi:hypothetical protein
VFPVMNVVTMKGNSPFVWQRIKLTFKRTMESHCEGRSQISLKENFNNRDKE